MVTKTESALVKVGEMLPTTVQETMALGQLLVESGMFPGITTKAQAVAKILAGQEIGLGPIYSLQHIYLVKGRLFIASETMQLLINRSAHYRVEIARLTDTEAELNFLRDGKLVYASRFTLDDAKRAGLVRPDSNWVTYPRDMLWARALSHGAKKVCPELLGGAESREVAEDERTIAITQPSDGALPASAWMYFWGKAAEKGFTSEDAVHQALGVSSVKWDWVGKGRTLEEALEVLEKARLKKVLKQEGQDQATEAAFENLPKPAPEKPQSQTEVVVGVKTPIDQQGPRKAGGPLISIAQWNEALRLGAINGWKEAELEKALFQHYGVKSHTELTVAQANDILVSLKGTGKPWAE